jgi:hypothetical protein
LAFLNKNQEIKRDIEVWKTGYQLSWCQVQGIQRR